MYHGRLPHGTVPYDHHLKTNKHVVHKVGSSLVKYNIIGQVGSGYGRYNYIAFTDNAVILIVGAGTHFLQVKKIKNKREKKIKCGSRYTFAPLEKKINNKEYYIINIPTRRPASTLILPPRKIVHC